MSELKSRVVSVPTLHEPDIDRSYYLLRNMAQNNAQRPLDADVQAFLDAGIAATAQQAV